MSYSLGALGDVKMEAIASLNSIRYPADSRYLPNSRQWDDIMSRMGALRRQVASLPDGAQVPSGVMSEISSLRREAWFAYPVGGTGLSRKMAIVGGAGAAAVIGGVAWWWMRRRKKRAA